MAALRLRIATSPPLAPLRALFLVAASSRTIADLKIQLVHDLGQLRGVAPAQLLLEVDGWELLDRSQVELVREEDIISVKLQEGPPCPAGPAAAAESPALSVEAAAPNELKKRKRSTPVPTSASASFVALSSTAELGPRITAKSAARPPAKKAKHSAKASIAPPVVTPALVTSGADLASTLPSASVTQSSSAEAREAQDAASSASSGSDLDSNASDDSSSSGSSSSSTSSSSSSSSSESSAPSMKSSRKPAAPDKTPAAAAPPAGTTIRLTPIIPLQPPVPPGSGSAATRERNMRRRAKKKALKAGGVVAGSPAPLSAAATSPVRATPTATPSADTDMETVEATIIVDQPPAFLSTQRDQVVPTVADVAAARLTLPAATELAIPFTISANRNKSKAFRKAVVGGLSGFKTVFDSPSGSETPSGAVTSDTASPVSNQPETPIPSRLSQPSSSSGALRYTAVEPPASYGTPTSAFASARKGKKGRPSAAGQQPSTPRPHMPAPSDRPPTSLPAGMFVTSVDVEDPVWEASVGGGAWAAYLGLEESKVKEQVWEKGALALDYGADEPVSVAPTAAARVAATAVASSAPGTAASATSVAPKDEADWAWLEAAFASANPLPWETLRIGSELLFTELILDPTTYSPSLALHHGTVAAITSDSVTLHVRAHYAEEIVEEDDNGDYDGQARGPMPDDWEERVVFRADWVRTDFRAVHRSNRL